jgi:hypothetical protein
MKEIKKNKVGTTTAISTATAKIGQGSGQPSIGTILIDRSTRQAP